MTHNKYLRDIIFIRRLLSKATSGRLVAAVVVDAVEAEAVAWAAHLAGSKSTSLLC